MVEVCEGAPVAVSGWVLTDRHDLAPCAANSLHQYVDDIYVFFLRVVNTEKTIYKKPTMGKTTTL